MIGPYYPHLQDPAVSKRHLPLLLLLFVGSGCAALIYEIVWFQLLQLVIGSSAVSLGVLLGTFMGGMCLGSLLLPRVVSRAAPSAARLRRARAAASASSGSLSSVGHAAMSAGFTPPIVGHGVAGILLRGAVCAVCLLPPTLLMGATLPAIARWVGDDARRASRGWASSTAATSPARVFGCLLAGFYLLRVYDMAIATFVAAVHQRRRRGGRARPRRLARRVARGGAPAAADTPDRARRPAPGCVYVAIALSGPAALGAEVVWTRLLSLMLGATVYTFSIILAVFLVGLGIGSAIGSLLAATHRAAARWRWAGARCCWPARSPGRRTMLARVAALLADRSVARTPARGTTSSSISCAARWRSCRRAPVGRQLSAGAGRRRRRAAQDPGRLVGGVYAANTVGAIVGALGFSMLADPAGRDPARPADPHRLSAVAILLLSARSGGPSASPSAPWPCWRPPRPPSSSREACRASRRCSSPTAGRCPRSGMRP